MARTPNQWKFFKRREFLKLIKDVGSRDLADELNVDYSTVRKWENGNIPSNRFQVAMKTIGTALSKGDSPAVIGRRIRDFIAATGLTTEDFGDLMGVSDKTVEQWAQGKTSPRSIQKLNKVLSNPRPLEEEVLV